MAIQVGSSAKRLWFHRTLAIAAGCAAVTLALWSAGLPPSQWVAGVQEWFGRWNADESTPTVVPSNMPTVAPVPKVEQSMIPAGIDSSISETPRGLVLTGTIIGRNHHEGLAFIGVNETNPQTYVAQAILANGARLAEIHSDHVVLERDGKRARLEVMNRSGPGTEAARPSSLLLVGGTKLKPVEFTNSVDPLADVIRTQPIYRDDLIAGFEVQAGRDAQAFRELGLLPGDWILTIDGSPPADPEQLAQLLAPLRDGAALAVSLRRASQAMNVSLDGRILRAKAERDTESKVLQAAGAIPTGP